MGRISIQDLAQALVTRNGLDKRDAATFVSEMFDIIQTNLEKDKIVKVKGLGTFKIIDVDDRESVNVNTGERVLIGGHNKITFTPDVLMKELVNKPFSQFETVVLNDGVNFEDMNSPEEPSVDNTDPNDPANMPLVDFGTGEERKVVDVTKEEAPDWVIEPVAKDTKPSPEPEPEPLVEPEPEPLIEVAPELEPESEPERVIEASPELEPEPVVEAAPEPEPVVESESQNEVEPEVEVFEPEEQETINNQKWLVALFACLLGVVCGYMLGNIFPWSQSSQSQDVKTEKVIPVTKSIATKVEPADSVVPVDTIKLAPVEVPAEKPVEAKPIEKPAEVKPVETKPAEPAVQYDKYAQMDNRVKYGAYRIVGTAQVVKVKAGDDLKRIARRVLGPDMECYLEVYNGMNSKTQLKEGQSIKIPKLESKKKKKKNI
jgi:nucleoid DNA-binding protein